MNIIWKFELKLTDIQSIQLSAAAEILSIQIQEGLGGKKTLCLWAKLNPLEAKAYRWIAIVGTGQEFEFEGKFLSTIQWDGLVWHVFEVQP